MAVATHSVPYPADSTWAEMQSELDSFDVKNLEGAGVVECWYWYHVGSYEGDGMALLRRNDGKWAVHWMSHCSCHGPVEAHDLEGLAWHDSIEDIKGSKEWEDNIRPLVEAAQKGLR